MATDNINDVALNLKVAATGGEQIRGLIEQLEALAKEGGQAAPEFKKLADELRSVGAQSDALAAFGKIEQEIQQATAAVIEQRTALAALKQQYEEQAASTQQFRDNQAKAAATLNSTQTALRETIADLRLLKTGQAEVREGTDAYDLRLRELNQSLARLRNTQADQKATLRETNAELKQSESTLKSVGDQYERAATSASQMERAISGQRQQLDLARSAMNATGVAATTLADATQEVDAAFEAARQSANKLVAEEQRLKSISEAVATSNERAVNMARQAAVERVSAAKQIADAEAAAARESEAAALKQKLASEEQIAAQRSLSEYIAQSNARNVALAEKAAAQRVAASKEAAAAERAAAEVTEAAALKQRLALQGIEANIRTAKTEAQALADRLQQALGVTGAKAAQQLEAEIKDVRDAMAFLRSSGELTGKELDRAFADGSRRINQLERDLREATGQMTFLDRAAKGFNSTVGQFAAGYLIAEAVQRLAVGALEANKNMETLQRGLKAVYGDARVTAQQIEFLQKTARDAGISVNDISKSFVQFSAAMKTSGFSLQTTQDLFKGITAEASNLGLSGDKVSDMLNALGQIASKGTVQLEELKNQLGDALPGALKRTADALGITLPELLELTASGKLLAVDVLPALGNAMKNTATDATTFQGVWANLKNTLSDVAVQVGDTGVWDTLKVILLGMSSLISGLGFAIQGTFDAITTGVKKAATIVAGFVDGDIRAAYDEVKRLDAEFIQRQTDRAIKVQESLKKNLDSYEAITSGQQKLGAAASAAGTQVQTAGNQIAESGAKAEAAGAQAAGAAKGLETNATAHQQAGTAAQGNAAAQTQAGAAATAAGAASTAAAAQVVQMQVAYGKVNAELDRQAKASTIAVEGAKQQGQAIERLAALTGRETDALSANVQAAQLNADATQRLADVRKTQLDVANAELAQIKALVPANEAEKQARQQQIATIEQQIAAKTELASKDQAAADAARAELEQKRLAAEVYRDNSARLGELSVALDTARQQLGALSTGFMQGKISAEQYQAGVASLNKTIALYADAVRDSIAAIDRKQQLEQAAGKTAQTLIQIEQQKAKTSEMVARAYGDERGAIAAVIEQKRLEIRSVEQAVSVKNTEINAEKERVAKLEVLKAKLGELTPAQQQELDLRKENIKTMEAENQLAKARVSSLDAEKAAIERRNAAAASGIANTGPGAGQTAKSILTRGGALVDENGFSKDMAGNTISAYGATKLSVINDLKGYGLSDAQANAIAREFVDSQGNVPYMSNPGQLKYGGRNSTLGYALMKAAQSVLDGSNPVAVGSYEQPGALFGGSGTGGGLSTRGPATSAPAVSSPAPAPASSTTTVRIEIGGQTKSINVASATDAATLTAMLQQIADASNRAGG